MTHPIDCFMPSRAPSTVGSAIQCAKGVVLPSNFMSGGQTNPVPKATPGSVPGPTASTSKAAYWVLGAVAVGGLAWWAWSSGALATAGIAANPKEVFVAKAPGIGGSIEADTVEGAQYRADQKWPRDWEVLIRGEYTSDGTHWGKGRGRAVAVREQGRWRRFAAANPIITKAASSVWEQAYREALREGLKKGEAEEYAFEVLQAYRDDEANRLGGALGSLGYPEDYASNPRKRRVSPAEKAARRIHEAATYLQGRPATIRRYDEPRDLKGPGRERWLVEVGPSQYGPAETFWVYSDHVLGSRRGHAASTRHLYRGDAELANVVDEVDRALELVGARANPGRAQKLGLKPSDFNPRELARGTKHELEHTGSRRVARRITMDHLAETWERAYKQAKKSGASDSDARSHAFMVLKHAKYYGHLDEMEKLQGEEERLYALERRTFRDNPKHRYRVVNGGGYIDWEGDSLKEAKAALARSRHNDGYAFLQFYDPGTADSPGDWFTYRERA